MPNAHRPIRIYNQTIKSHVALFTITDFKLKLTLISFGNSSFVYIFRLMYKRLKQKVNAKMYTRPLINVAYLSLYRVNIFVHNFKSKRNCHIF